VSGAAVTVLHVLPYDLDRGAQRYARALVDRLDTPEQRHLILTLFTGNPVVLDADVELAVPQGGLRRLGVDPRAVLRLRRYFSRHRPGVVVAHGGEPAKYVALAAPSGLPFVYLSIGSAHPKLRKGYSRALHRFYTRRADAVVAVSTPVAQEATDLHGIDPDRIVVIPNGRDPAQFKPGPPQSGGQVRLIFVGHLDEGKRPDRFVELVRELRGRGRDLEAKMVGEGPLAGLLAGPAREAGVDMVGRRDDVPELLAGSDLLVLTSRPPEGMPGVLIEAGLSGLPVVSTRIAGASDVVEDGVTGILVDVDDFDGLVMATERLVTDAGLRREMGRRARERCTTRFTLDATADRWRDLLAGLVSTPIHGDGGAALSDDTDAG
jgi:glycosyltransferase involved in cell wall biosynthesis